MTTTMHDCNRCLEQLVITGRSVFESWEDKDKNRHFPVECPHGHAHCKPIIVHDGGNGSRRYDLPFSQ